MTGNSRSSSRLSSMSSWIKSIPWLLIPILAFSLTSANAQQLTGTLSGIATDQSEARVPGAKIVVINEGTGDARNTVADSAGFFSVTALVPSTYTVSITATGFNPWKETGILLNSGDSRTIPAIKLAVATKGASITVVSGEDAEVPSDNAEISSTLNNELVDSAVLTGRNAAELIKMMPGITFNNGSNAGSAYNSSTTGTNNGPAGQFSANGTQPYGSTAVILDGANLIDPGNAGTQVANINQDMTDSVKYLSASYGAEYAKGPAVLQAFSKSGTQKFHGEGYLYARNSNAGYSNDWYNKVLDATNNQPNEVGNQHFYYFGGNVGGPITFPHFNKNRDRLFFWFGYENMKQQPYNVPNTMNVPTDAQRGGDFSNAGVDPHVVSQWPYVYSQPCPAASWNSCNATETPWIGQTTGLNAYFDPAGVIIGNLIPHANTTPNKYNGWNNYQYGNETPVNRWETTGKVTYSINDNNKLWGSYAYQSEVDDHPVDIWWAPSWTIPYPSAATAHETANLYLANFTHVFSPTTTNEFVFAYAKFVNPNKLNNPSAANPTSLGFPSQSLFNGKVANQIPNFAGPWAGGQVEINQFAFQSGIYGPNSFGKTSKSPNITDTFTKIIKTHSVKAGFYWDTQENLQSPGADFQGTNNYSPWGGQDTGNVYADMYMGFVANYTETSTIPIPDYLQHQWSIWAQDSWKANRRLTLNLGLRADHEGQWYDKIGGTQVWDPSSYVNTAAPPANTGLLWHQTSSKVSNSGLISPLFYYNPRLGAAYDVFGNGRTVVRGGFGTYRYQLSSNDAGWAMNGPLGSFEFSTGSVGYAGYSNLTKQGFSPPQGLNQVGATIAADAEHDNKVPYANTYSFGVAQALPAHTVIQASYVGSASRNQLEYGSNGHISDANAIQIGAFFKPDPLTGAPAKDPSSSGFSTNDFFPLRNYQHIWIVTHGGWANYNSLQVAAQKQSGNLFLFTNFTFGKVLGTRDGSTSNGNGNGSAVQPFVLGDNYGPLAYDHTKAFNVSFSYKLPKPVHNNALLAGAVNGWEVSGYTTYQDGAPLQPNTGGTINATYSAKSTPQVFTMPNGLTTTGIGYTNWFGTNQFENSLQPLVLFNPKKGLKKNQYFNPNAFAAPQYGVVGPWIMPYIKAPHYWGSDMAVFKAFRVTESQRVEFRLSATNWLNHPNAVFGQNGINADQQLTFVGVSDSSGLVTNSEESTTGIPASKVGYRWLQYALKYYF
jgi:Carboxypeptidase regulatory-like domain/TonB-dependent Receptor Plug Domain